MINKREDRRADVLAKANKKLTSVFEEVRDFALEYHDQEMIDESSRILHQVNRIRNIDIGRRFFTNDGLDETSRKDLYEVPREQDVIGGGEVPVETFYVGDAKVMIMNEPKIKEARKDLRSYYPDPKCP